MREPLPCPMPLLRCVTGRSTPGCQPSSAQAQKAAAAMKKKAHRPPP